ncbi:hypothetical protein HII36_31900 [Nonomuraea sp. NN258]|uniref:DUF7144 family membrane protein n=1 Tax=Nonomuraea antri TaxID=2730852 RepID=UPI001568A61F|nr:hypothetical protein [Nonomuraea antri]NRQ36405.1 hypothetical protein [Nonomuraea antri]
MAPPAAVHRHRREPGGVPVGGAILTETMTVVVGTFQVIQGLAAITLDRFSGTARPSVIDVAITACAWIHLGVGTFIVITGCLMLTGRRRAGRTGLVLVVLDAGAQFLFMPAHPIWALLMIGMDLGLLRAFSRRGAAAFPMLDS